MADYLKLIEKGAGVVGLEDDLALIQTLVEMADNWEELANGVGGARSASELFAKIAADIDGETVTRAFAALNLSETQGKLSGLLGKVKALEGKIPEKYKKLLEPLSTYDAGGDGEVEWSLIDRQEEFSGGDFKLGLSGGAKIALEAGDKEVIDGAEQHPLLRIGTELAVGAKGGGKVPFPQGSLGLGAEASAATSLKYYFKVPSAGALYAFAVAERIPALPSPFDFGAVWKAFASDTLALSAIVYVFNGAAKANVEITLADTASFGADLVAELGMSISADASFESEYMLTLAKGDPAAGGGREIRAVLSRERATTEKLALGLKIDVDLSKLAQRVHAMLKKVVDKWDSVLKEIKPFLSPGTYIQTELSELLGQEAERLIGNAELRDVIVRDLRGVIGIDTGDDSALTDWLSGEVSGAIDSVRGVLADQTEGAVQRVTNALSHRLPAFARPEVANRLQPAIQSLVDKAEEKLRAKVDELRTQASDHFVSALRKAGAETAGVVTDLDQALASVRSVIEKYDALFHDMLDKTADAARAKISARIQAEEEASSGENYQISGWLEADSENAGKVFHALTRGEKAGLRALFAGDTPSGGFRLDEEKSSLRTFSKRVSKMGYDVVLFGFAASGELIMSGEAAVEIDGNGKVQVDSVTNVARRFKGRMENREVSFVDTFSLVRTKLVGRGLRDERTAELGASVTHHDKSLKLGEMRGFVESLEEHELLPPASVTVAEQHFFRWAGTTSKDAALPADIAAKLWLSKREAETLMMLDRRDPRGRLTREAGVAIVRTALGALYETTGMSKKRFEQAAEFVLADLYRERTSTVSEILYDIAKVPRTVEHRLPRDSERFREDVKGFLDEQQRMKGLVDMIDTMGLIYQAQPDVPGQPSPLGWDAAMYRAAQHSLGLHSQAWLLTGGEYLFWIKREVQPRMVAFLWTVAQLGRGTRENAMSLTMTHHPETGQAETVELVSGA